MSLGSFLEIVDCFIGLAYFSEGDLPEHTVVLLYLLLDGLDLG